jgi:predicted RNA-binding Zn-ribbon protein involved in translation (DUF1610 family)
MYKYKKRLIIFLVIQAILTVLHNLISRDVSAENFYFINNWTYYLVMSWGVFIVIYALRLNCPNCGAMQVIRGISILSLRWPEAKCHKCGVEIE